MAEVTKRKIGRIKSNDIFSFTLKNKNGVEVTVINFGGRITSIKTPDRNGSINEITLNYETLEDYLHDTSYLGAICGRVAGRIKNGEFTLDGKTFRLSQNDGNHHIHGGIINFSFSVWQAQKFIENETVKVVLFYQSADGEEGYPGNIDTKVTYMLNEKNEFIIDYEGIADKNTIINLTNHSYFNLSGDAKKNILEHLLQIDSKHFLELDNEAIPTGTRINVEDTAFDFRTEKTIKEQLSKNHSQLKLSKGGFNHPFILKNHFNQEIILKDEESGRKLIVETDLPSVVVYTSSYFDESFSVNGRQASKFLGICLETQGFPDAINHKNFPSIILMKGEKYQAKTKFTFEVINH